MAFESFPGDDAAALDAAARALLFVSLEFALAQLHAEPPCVHDHWNAAHVTVAFTRPSRRARYVRSEYASDDGVYALSAECVDACRRAAVRAFLERFAYAPTPYPRAVHAPVVDARTAPSRPGMPPHVVARATAAVGDDAAAVLAFTAPPPVFARFAPAVFGALVVAIARVSGPSLAGGAFDDGGDECVFAGPADDAEDYALAELVTRLRRLAVTRAAGGDVVVRLELREPAPRGRAMARASLHGAAHSGATRLFALGAAVVPIDEARATHAAALGLSPAELVRPGARRAASIPVDIDVVGTLEQR